MNAYSEDLRKKIVEALEEAFGQALQSCKVPSQQPERVL
jgi:hypothetical protein